MSATMTRWEELTRRTLEEVERCEPIYRPTTFWGPGIRSIVQDLAGRGLGTFKSWPSAGTWFYPTYGTGFGRKAIDAAFEAARRMDERVSPRWFQVAVGGRHQAERDFDAARIAWDQHRWPFDLEGLGESEAGAPPQAFRLATGTSAAWTRPYLNYLLCLAGLSRHVDATPKRFLELGGGFGVLGEIVLSRDSNAVYVDVDLPPLLTVASWYLDALFGERLSTYESMPREGPIGVTGSACVPSWRLRDISGPFDVFVNSLSFQEMEPDVVERYANDVVALDVTWVVSLNSRAGKPIQSADRPIGVLTPVTSQVIVELFEARGYRCAGRYGAPLIRHQAELVILRRDDRRGPPNLAAAGSLEPSEAAQLGTRPATVDLRRAIVAPSREERRAARRASRVPGRARGQASDRASGTFAKTFVRLLRGVRRRLRR
jgi:putative sugar O-methyltransferase